MSMSIFSGITGRRGLYKIGIALTLVLAIATSLWFAVPTQAFDVTFSPLPASGTLGTSYSFTVTVSIADAELLPIQSADLYIYLASAPATYRATCASLPLNAGTKPYTEAQTGGGAVSVAATAGSGWAYGYGYGYGVWGSTGYHFFPPGGYGYGYGYGAGATSLSYSVTWVPPSSGWPVGDYKAEVVLTANGNTFSQVSSAFLLAAPAAGGGVAPTGGVTPVSSIVTSSGVFTQGVTASSVDSKAAVTIAQNTQGLTSTGLPLSQISVTPLATPPAPPADTNVIGVTYNFGPEGATFDRPVTIKFTYDPAQIPSSVDEKNLVIAVWDGSSWVRLTSTVDPLTHTVTAQVTHFTVFSVLAPTRPAAFAVSNLSITPTKVDMGKEVTISVVVANTGDLTGTYRVTLKIDNATVTTKDVILTGNTSQTVTFVTSKPVAGFYTVDVNGLGGTFTVAAAITPTPTPTTPTPTPVPAAFTVGSLSITPATVDVGQNVNIKVTVTNTGDLTGTYKVTLKINNTVSAELDVTVAGKSSQPVTFTTSRDVAGTYAVEVAGLFGTFTVNPGAPPPPPPPTPINWALIGGIIGAVIVVAVAIFFILRRRRAAAI